MLLYAFTALSACGDDDPHVTVHDRDGRLADQDEIEIYRGPAHCDWAGVTFLRVGWPVGRRIGPDARMYVRDPDGVLTDQTVTSYNEDAALPKNARYTGYSSDLGELWLAPDQQDTVAYLVTDDEGSRVEAWPRVKTVLGCD